MFFALIFKIQLRIPWFRNSIRKEDHMPTIALRKLAHGGVGEICKFDGLLGSVRDGWIEDDWLGKAWMLVGNQNTR